MNGKELLIMIKKRVVQSNTMKMQRGNILKHRRSRNRAKTECILDYRAT